MAKKVTQAEVEARCAALGWILDDTFTRMQRKHWVICPEGHRHEKNLDNLLRIGRGCGVCSGRLVTPEDAIARTVALGWTLDDTYGGANDKHWVICPEGHRHQKKLSHLWAGHGCTVCAGQVITQEQAESRCEAQGWTLDDTYTTSQREHWMICPEGHRHRKAPSTLWQGRGCVLCAPNARITQEEAEARCDVIGWTLDDTYKSDKRRHRAVCPEGHTRNVILATLWAQAGLWGGNGCSECRRVSQEEAEARTAALGWTLDDAYTTSNDKLGLICPQGHQTSARLSHVWGGMGCGICAVVNQRLTHDEAVERAAAAGHKLNETYRGSHVRHSVTCMTCGLTYKKIVSDLWSGRGCPDCSRVRFDYATPAVVYLIWVSDFDVKYGVTNLDPGLDPRDGHRVPKLERSLPGKLCDWWEFDTGQDAYEVEQRVGRFYLNHRPQDPADGDGYTERIKGVYLDEVRQTIDRIRVPAGSQLALNV